MLHCSPIRTLLRGSKANAGFQKFKLDADKQKAFQNSRKAPAENPYPFQPSSDPQMSCIDAQRAILDFRVLFLGFGQAEIPAKKSQDKHLLKFLMSSLSGLESAALRCAGLLHGVRGQVFFWMCAAQCEKQKQRTARRIHSFP